MPASLSPLEIKTDISETLLINNSILKMKKFIWILAAALPMVFTSCGDDNDEMLTLDQTEMSVNYQGTAVKLKASEKNCTWTSENDFIAEVDGDGNVTPKHVGTTTIVATKDGNKATCKVTVNPTNTKFTNPVLTFGANVEAVKASVAAQKLNLNLNDEEEEKENGVNWTTLYYSTGMDMNYPWYAYIFEENKLATSALTVGGEDDMIALDSFLQQYYDRYGETEDGYVYRNAATEAKATVWVEYELDVEDDNATAYYTSTSSTKGGDVFASPAMKMAKKAVRKASARK